MDRREVKDPSPLATRHSEVVRTQGGTMKHRIPALVAAIALAALAVPLVIGVASAATPMTLQPALFSTPTLPACSTPTFPVLRTRPPTNTPNPSFSFPLRETPSILVGAPL